MSRKDLLPRINGFELMMAPYRRAPTRLGLALASGLAEENGLERRPLGLSLRRSRLRVFLTNTLELDARPARGGIRRTRGRQGQAGRTARGRSSPHARRARQPALRQGGVGVILESGSPW